MAELTSVQTDSESNYSYVWTVGEAGTFELVSAWYGDEVYEAAESSIVTVTVEGEGPTRRYDPWPDVNDDGKINIMDLTSIATKFGTSGNPINKTALLLELQSKIDSLNASLVMLESEVNDLEARSPTVITVHESSRYIPNDGEWHDIISVSNVTVWEGANVFAIVSLTIESDFLTIRHRANSTYGEYRTFIPYLAELHHLFTNLSAGTYTFAIQGRQLSASFVQARNPRLTLVII